MKILTLFSILVVIELFIMTSIIIIVSHDDYELYQTTNLKVLDLRDNTTFNIKISLSSENDHSYRFIAKRDDNRPFIIISETLPPFVDALYNATVTNFNTEPYVTLNYEVVV